MDKKNVVLVVIVSMLLFVPSAFAYDRICFNLMSGVICIGNGTVSGINFTDTQVNASNIMNPYWLNTTDQRYNDTVAIGKVSSLASSLGNWSSDKSSYDTTVSLSSMFYALSNPYNYYNSSTIPIYALENSLLSVGNWSADKSAYALLSSLSSVNSSLNNEVVNRQGNDSYLQGQINGLSAYNDTNLSNRITIVNSTVNSLGNWSSDKSNYNTTAQNDLVYATKNSLSSVNTTAQNALPAIDQRYNDTVLANQKALPGNCASGFVVQNTTTSGVQCISASTGSVTSIATTNPINGGTITSTGTISLNETYMQRYNSTSAISSLGNWSADKSSYTTTINLPVYQNGSSNLTMSNVVSGVGNWTNDKTGYVTIGTLSSYALNSFVTSAGNWTVDKTSYNTTTQNQYLYLNISDQRYNDSTSITNNASLKANISGGNTLSGNQIINGNLTGNQYIMGQPLLGMLGSGIISTTQGNALLEVNVTCSGLTCSYNNFVVRLNQGTSNQTSTYCNISSGTKTASNNVQSVMYVDSNCAVQITDIDTWFNSLITVGGQWDFANMVCYDGGCEVVNGIGLEQRRMMKQRVIDFDLHHLQVVDGFSKTTNTWPNFTLDSGRYVYLMDIDTTSSQTTGTANKVEVIYPNTTGWVHVDQTRMNFTSCTNGTAAITCTNTNQWRRVFFFVVGWNESSGDSTGLHQLLPSNTIRYASEASCLDTVATPLTYTLPSYYVHSAVPLYAYCVRPQDNAWSSTGWIDLRTVKTGSSSTSSSGVFVPYTGASQNVDFGGFNLSASYTNANVNASYVQNPYWLNTTDQRYNDSAGITSLNSSKANIGSTNTFQGAQNFNSTIYVGNGLTSDNATIIGGSGWFVNLYTINLSVANINSPVVLNGSYIPFLTNTFSLGNSSSLWTSVYATNLYGNLNWSYLQNVPSYALVTYVNSVGNWSTDKSSYSTTSAANLLYSPISEPKASSLGNWSADKSSYTTTANLPVYQNGSSNLTTAQVVTAVGNWSNDKSSYITTSQFTSIGNWTNDKSGYVTTGTLSSYALNTFVTSAGNWSTDKSSYTTTANLPVYNNGSSNLTMSQVVTGVGNWTNDKGSYALDSRVTTVNSTVNSIGNYTANGMPLAGGTFTGNISMGSNCVTFSTGGSICG